MSKERRKSPRKSAAKRSLSPLFSSPNTSNSFLSPVSFAPHLSPAHEAPTDRGLTFLQSARDRNVPVRFGKWSRAEDAYLHKLVQLFQNGLLANVACKTSLRSWLAQMLNCCPMRISKKQMHGRGFKGKSKYNPAKPATLAPQQFEQLSNDVRKLRNDFLRNWADDEADKQRKSFQQWYDKVQELVPTPQIAKPGGVEDTKRRKTSEIADQEAAAVALGPIPVLEPISVASCATPTTVAPLPLAFCSDNMISARQCNELQIDNEARYTICEDQVQFSFHVDNQQNLLSMTRKSSRVFIDFGAPSCWHEEPKCSPFLDYSQWTDNDLTEELAALVEPSSGWDSPPLNFL
uniref:Uncharacterized protein n=1 Tax=Phytophthora ramorum TaxID=164328 RepID=H3GLM6_PHYRM